MLSPVNRQLTLYVGVKPASEALGGGIGQPGPPGATGPAGPQGPTGAQGPTGSQGPAGTNGTNGINGAPGVNGINGANGAQGPAGPAGDVTRVSNTSLTIGVGSKTFVYTLTATNIGWTIGTRLRAYALTGIMEGQVTAVSSTQVTILVDYFTGSGSTSPWNLSICGEKGVDGVNGTNGTNGLNGAAGAAGPAGPAGADGATGLKGDTGDQGDPGPEGPPGPAGIPGSDGLSAYQIAVIDGFGGDESAWLASLVGPTGSTGSTGPIGPIGPTGADSTVPGPAGTSILYGTAVPTTEGNNGDYYIRTTTNFLYGPKAAGTWPSGISLIGPQGATGPTGPTGATGADSTVPGPTGPTGPAGPTGDTGPIGPAGSLSDGNKGNITVSGSGTNWVIDDNVVTNVKLADVATSTIKGRVTAATGDPEDLTPTQVRALLNVQNGSTANDTNASLRDRSSHTGTQVAGTISDLGEAIDDRVAALLVAGANVTLSYNDATNTLTINSVTQNPIESLIVAVGDESTVLTTGTSKISFRMPYALTLTDIKASLVTAQDSGSLLTVDVNENGASILTTKLTFDNTETTTVTATTPRVISDPSLANDAVITIDIDQVGASTLAAGLKVTLIGSRT